VDDLRSAVSGFVCGSDGDGEAVADGNHGRAADDMRGEHVCIAWREHTGGRRDRHVVDSDRSSNGDVQSEPEHAGRNLHSHRWNGRDNVEMDGLKSAVHECNGGCGAYHQAAADYRDGWRESNDLARWHNRADWRQHAQFWDWNVDHRNGRVYRDLQLECDVDPSDGKRAGEAEVDDFESALS
jgi:hypothetical protein